MQMTWDWVAGFMVGEGHIAWLEAKKGKQGTCGRIVFGQVSKEPLQAIKDFLMTEGFDGPLLYQRKKAPEGRKRLWILAIQRRPDVIKFLRATHGMLFQKQEKANYVLHRLEMLIRERETILGKATQLRMRGNSWREIARQTGIHRTALTSYFRSRGIVLKDDRAGLDWKSRRQDLIDRGLCEDCQETRGPDGTGRKCRPCATIINRRAAAWKKARVDQGLCRNCGQPRGTSRSTALCEQCSERRRQRRRKPYAA